MDGISLTLLAALAVLGAAAGGAALWQQRRFVAELKRQLVQAEAARRELTEQLRDLALHLRAQADDDAPAAAPNDAEARKRALERVLDAAAGPHGGPGPADFPWLETMPHEPPEAEKYSFATTEPAALDRTVDIPLDRR